MPFCIPDQSFTDWTAERILRCTQGVFFPSWWLSFGVTSSGSTGAATDETVSGLSSFVRIPFGSRYLPPDFITSLFCTTFVAVILNISSRDIPSQNHSGCQGNGN